MARPVFIDCDPGLDDAIALMVLAARKDVFDLKGITTVAGNQTGAKTYENARRLAAYLKLNVPVVKGAERPLFRTPLTAGDYHGEDGLAGMRVGSEMVPEEKSSAIHFLYRDLMAIPDPVTLLATGPLTNLAVLFEKHPVVKDRIDHITIMGGSLSGGNVTPYAEFNFCADPHAAKAVLSAGVPIHLLGLDVTHQAYLTDEEIKTFGALGTKYGGMVGDLMQFYAVSYKQTGLPGTPIHDASAVLYEAQPELFPESRDICLDVVTGGERQGECLVAEGEPNVRFVTGVNREAFVQALYRCCQ